MRRRTIERKPFKCLCHPSAQIGLMPTTDCSHIVPNFVERVGPRRSGLPQVSALIRWSSTRRTYKLQSRDLRRRRNDYSALTTETVISQRKIGAKRLPRTLCRLRHAHKSSDAGIDFNVDSPARTSLREMCSQSTSMCNIDDHQRSDTNEIRTPNSIEPCAK